MDPATVHITRHAKIRMLERWPNGSGPRNIEKTFRKHLRQAKQIVIDPAHAVTRIINNGFKPALYYAWGQWVFVISSDGKAVVSCELKSMWH